MQRTPIIFLLFWIYSSFAYSEWKGLEYEFEEEKPWVELQVPLPSYPEEKNLLPFEVNVMSKNQFFIDAQSISVGDDGAVRYTLVIKTSGGAKNISFEGIRCKTIETRVYAFGRSDGTWGKASTVQWREISPVGVNAYAKTLYQDFFCPGSIIIHNSAEAIKALRRGVHERATSPHP